MIGGLSFNGLLWRARRFLVGERSARFQYECRRCGHSASRPHQHCPQCGAAEMARYEL